MYGAGAENWTSNRQRITVVGTCVGLLLIGLLFWAVGLGAAAPTDGELAINSEHSSIGVSAEHCDSTVSEEESIQNSVDDATANETICVESGVYEESVSIDVEGLTVVAADGASPTLQGAGNDNGFTIEDAPNVTIQGFEVIEFAYGIEALSNTRNITVAENNITANDRGVRINSEAAPNATIRDNTITENTARGIEVYDSPGTTFVNNSVNSNDGYGVRIYSADSTVVNNSAIENEISGFDFTGDNLVFRNNTAEGSGYSRVVQVEESDGSVLSDNTIVGPEAERGLEIDYGVNNTIRNNTFSGGSNFVDLRLGDVSFSTIQDNDFQTGINLESRTQALEHFQHDIDGNSIDGAPIVYATGADDPEIPDSPGQIIVVDSVNVSISNVSIEDAATGIQIAHSDGTVIENSTIRNSSQNGITTWSSENIIVRDSNISDNFADGVKLYASPDATIQNSTVNANVEDGIVGAGIYVWDGSDRVSIVESEVNYNERKGIYVRESQDVEIRNNNVSENTGIETHSRGHGIRFFGDTTGGLVHNNTVLNNLDSGIDNGASRPDGVTITNNTVSGTGGDGIYILGDYHVIANNTVTDNSGHAIRMYRDGAIKDNYVEDGTVQASSGTEIVRNTVLGDTDTMGIIGGTLVRDNVVENHRHGIEIIAENALVENNTATDNHYDIVYEDDVSTTIRNNSLQTGIVLTYWNLPDDLSEMLTIDGNTVQGDPIFYTTGSNVEAPDEIGQAIIVNATNVTVSDQTFDGVSVGAQAYQSEGVTINNNTFSNSSAHRWDSEGAITVQETVYSSIERNTLSDIQGYGIEGEKVENSTIRDNTITGSDDTGMYLEDSVNLSVAGNDIMDSGDEGVYVNMASDRDTLELANNEISGSTSDGISVDATGLGAQLFNITVVGNVLENNNDAGLRIDDDPVDVTVEWNQFDGNGEGLVNEEPDYIVNATRNWWGHDSGPSGDVTDPVTGELADGFGDSVSAGATFDPWLEEEPINADYFSVQDIDAPDTVTAGETIQAAATIENIGIHSGTQNVTLTDFNGEVVDTTTQTVESGTVTTVTLNWTTSDADVGIDELGVSTANDSATAEVTVAPDGIAEIDSCGEIELAATYNVTEDLTDDSEDTCLTVLAADVTIQGNGHTIDGVTGDGGSVGIQVQDVTNVSIENLQVTGWHDGVTLVDTTNSTVSAIEATDNEWSGIRTLGSSDHNLIAGSTAETNRYGIYLHTSSQNQVLNSTARHNEMDGIRLNWMSDGNHLENNTLVANERDGIRIDESDGDGNVVLHNIVRNNSNAGIHMNSSTGTVIDANELEANGGPAIAHTSSFETTIENNTIEATGGPGIHLEGEEHTVESNEITDVEGPGIVMDATIETAITDNLVANATIGIDSHTDLEGDGPEENLIRGNEILNTTETGLHFEESANNTITANTIHDAPWAVSMLNATETVEELDIGSSTAPGTVVTFTGENTSVGTAAAPGADPTGYESIDRYVDTAPTTDTNALTLTLHYDASDVANVSETSLSLLHENGNWSEASDLTVNNDEQTVSATGAPGDTHGVFGQTDPLETGTIAGEITENESQPIANATVTAADSNRSYQATTEEDGTYGIEIPTGTYTLTATAESYKPANQSNVTITTNDTTTWNTSLEYDPDPGILAGTIVDADTGDPIDYGWAEVSATHEDTGDTWTESMTYESDFELQLPVGTYTVDATVNTEGPDYEGSIEGIQINDSEVTSAEVPVEELEYAQFTHDPDTPTEGETVTFDASNSSTTWGEPDEYRWDFTNDGEFDVITDDPVTTHTFNSAGDHDVQLLILGGEFMDSTTTEITVESQDTTTPPSPPPAPAPAPDETLYIEESVSDGSISIAEYGVDAGTPVEISLDWGDIDLPIDLTSIEFTVVEETNLELELISDEEPPTDDAESFYRADGTDALQYQQLLHDVPEEAVADVEFEFELEEAALEADEDPGDVAMYRLNESADPAWVELETTVLDEGQDRISYVADSPGLSEFVTGVKQPQFEISDAVVEVTELSVGDSTQIEVSITNTGGADGTFTAQLLIDGDLVEEQDLTIAEGGTRQTTFDQTFDEAGSYEVIVNDVSSGEVEVAETDDDGGIGLTAVVLGVLVVVVIAAAGVFVLNERGAGPFGSETALDDSDDDDSAGAGTSVAATTEDESTGPDTEETDTAFGDGNQPDGEESADPDSDESESDAASTTADAEATEVDDGSDEGDG